jgi:hypothetical protein
MPRLAVVPDLEQELDGLFGVSLDEFTARRNELAGRLKSAGQADAAEQVRALRKPSVPVWAVNQLARRDPDTVAKAVEAGRQLREAQEAAFGGGGADAVRRATADERGAVRELTRAAERLLEDEGRKPTRAVVDRIGATLRAAAVDPDAAGLLARGRLTGELESPGFTAVASLAPPPAKGRRGRAAAPAAPDRAAKRAHEQRVRRLEQRLDTLERKAEQAAGRAERAEADAIAAREAADGAAEELKQERARGPG